MVKELSSYKYYSWLFGYEQKKMSDNTLEISNKTLLLNEELQEELNFLSDKYKLPRFAENGIDYLLKCSELKGREAIREFLK